VKTTQILTVIAVQKLRSGDLAIYIHSLTAKKDLEAETGWVESITPGAIMKRRTWPVLVHRERIATRLLYRRSMLSVYKQKTPGHIRA
jgi:hypothetical protein